MFMSPASKQQTPDPTATQMTSKAPEAESSGTGHVIPWSRASRKRQNSQRARAASWLQDWLAYVAGRHLYVVVAENDVEDCDGVNDLASEP